MCFSALTRKNIRDIEVRLGAEKASEVWEQLFGKKSEFPKDYKVAENGERFFCGDKYYVPVYYRKGEKLICEPMRYGKYYGPKLRTITRGKRTEKRCNYNTRLDNLNSPAWADAYQKGHGFIVLDGFFENVLVEDLLRSGGVTLAQVKAHFAALSLKRKERILSEGKAYKPTKTELKDPVTRSIVIEFNPQSESGLFVPVIFNHDEWGQNPFKGFSLLTTDPSPEILAAGHDRCPIILKEEALSPWLKGLERTHEEILEVLSAQVTHFFTHKLEEFVA